MDGFLEHSPSRDKPVLQGPHLPEEKSDFGGSPLYVELLFFYTHAMESLNDK